MESSLLATLSLAFVSTMVGMDQIKENSTHDEYKEFKSWSNSTDSPLIDGFFLDNDHIVLAKQNGVCASYCINNPEQSEVIFTWPTITNIKDTQLRKVMYDPQSKYICALSNVYTINPRSMTVQQSDEYNSLERSIGQLFFLKKVTDNLLSRPINFIGQMINFIDPEFKFLSMYSPLDNGFRIWLLLDKEKALQIYSDTPIANIAFHSLKNLCVMALVEKTRVKTNHLVNNIYIAETESLKEEKFVQLISTKNWTTLWKRSGEARDISFNPEGTHFAYIKNNRLCRSLTKDGQEVTSINIPETLQQIVSVDFNNDFEVVVSDTYNKKRAFFDMHQGICSQVVDIVDTIDPERCFSDDKLLKAEIDPYKVRLYKK